MCPPSGPTCTLKQSLPTVWMSSLIFRIGFLIEPSYKYSGCQSSSPMRQMWLLWWRCQSSPMWQKTRNFMAMPTWPFTKLAFLTFLDFLEFSPFLGFLAFLAFLEFSPFLGFLAFLAFLEFLEFLPSLEFLANDRSRSCSRFDVSSKWTNLYYRLVVWSSRFDVSSKRTNLYFDVDHLPRR